eukprot:scaffold65302_cov38-Phaeocystis_antarctica.AAC.3
MVTSCAGCCARAPQQGQNAPRASTPARPLCLLRARQTALDSSALPGRGRPTGHPATASGARASHLPSRRCRCV